jgi:hypothetical protein
MVCKSFIHQFDSDRRLQIQQQLTAEVIRRAKHHKIPTKVPSFLNKRCL